MRIAGTILIVYLLLKSSIMKIRFLFYFVFLITLISACNNNKHPQTYGLILYTVRDAARDDIESTIREVAAMGYSFIELANYNLSNGTFYGKKPEDIQKLCEDNGLWIVSSHTNLMNLVDSSFILDTDLVSKMLKDHKAAGITNIVNSGLPNSWRKDASFFYKAAEILNSIGEIAKAEGVNILYHNHAWEFINFGTKTGMEILLTETDPSLVQFQIDAYWVVKADKDPLEMIRSHPGRFTIMHVKDMDNSEERTFTEVGEGIIPYIEIIPLAKAEGVKYFIVEQDHGIHDQMVSARMSIDYLMTLK
jgi:sugar phosphate isomerase/epimerase